MAFSAGERVNETTTTTGTGSYALGGAVTGFQSFSAGIGAGNVTTYVVEDGTDWEVGVGTFTTGPDTLSRDFILASSNAGAAVSWGAGTKDIYVGYPATYAMINTCPFDNASNNHGSHTGNRRTTASDGDEAYISFKLDDDSGAGSASEFARLTWEANDVSAASKQGEWRLGVMRDNTLTDIITVNNTGVTIQGGSGEPTPYGAVKLTTVGKSNYLILGDSVRSGVQTSTGFGGFGLGTAPGGAYNLFQSAGGITFQTPTGDFLGARKSTSWRFGTIKGIDAGNRVGWSIEGVENATSNFYGGATFKGTTSTTGSPVAWTFDATGMTHTGLTASAEASDFVVNMARTVQFATGAKTNQRAARFHAPTYGAVGATTITNAASVYISGAPAAGANVTITNAMALWVDDGLSIFDGRVGIGTADPDVPLEVKSTGNAEVYISGTGASSLSTLWFQGNSGGAPEWAGISYNAGIDFLRLWTGASIQAHLGIDSTGNVYIGTVTECTGTEGKCLIFGDNAGDPTPGTNTAGIYGKDVAGTVEMFAIDEAANAAQLSAHNKEGDYVINSFNAKTGRKFKVQLEKLLLRLAEKFPEDFAELIEVEDGAD